MTVEPMCALNMSSSCVSTAKGGHKEEMAVAAKRKAPMAASRKTEQTKAIGERIKHGRELMGMTQPEFGEIMGVSWRTVQMWEYGEHPPYRHMRRIAEVLEQDVGFLLHGEAAVEAHGDKLEKIEAQLAQALDMLQQLLARE